MNRESFVSDLIGMTLPMALVLIKRECKSKKKSKEKDEILDEIRDTILVFRPLPKVKK